MSVSPADFELYSRVTGTPLPRTPAEQMQMAPYVYNFIRSQGYAEPNIVQRTAGTLGKIALLGAAGAGLYGLTKLGTEGTVTSTADPTPTPKPPQDQGVWQRPLGTRSMQEAGQPQPEKTRNVRIPVYTKENYGSVQSEPQTDSDLAIRDASGLTDAPTGSSELAEKDQSSGGLLGKQAEDFVTGITARQGGQYVRSGAPLVAGAGIGTHAAQNLLGGVANEGGAVGQGIRSGYWGTLGKLLRQAPGVDPLVTGVEGVGNIGSRFGHSLGDVASSALHAVPGYDVATNALTTGGAELGLLAAGVAADSAVQDTILAGAKLRAFLDPTGQTVPSVIKGVGQFHNEKLVPYAGAFHQNVLVPGGQWAGRRAVTDYNRGIIKPQVDKATDYISGKVGEGLDYASQRATEDTEKVKTAYEKATAIPVEVIKEGLLQIADPAFKQQQETQNVDEVGPEHDLNDQPQIPDADQKISDENRITTQESVQAGDDPWFPTPQETPQVTTSPVNTDVEKFIAQFGSPQEWAERQRLEDSGQLDPTYSTVGQQLTPEQSEGQAYMGTNPVGDLVTEFQRAPGKRYTYSTTDSADEFLKAVGNLGPVPYDNPESNRAQGYLRKGQDYKDPEAVDESLRRSSEQMEAAEDLERGIKSGVFGGEGVRASQVVSHYAPNKKFSGFGQEMVTETGRVSDKTGRPLKDRQVKKYTGSPDKGAEYVKEFISKRVLGE